MNNFTDSDSPAEARERWHREAAERDAAYLALGPADMTETNDGPWSAAETLHHAEATTVLRAYHSQQKVIRGQ